MQHLATHGGAQMPKYSGPCIDCGKYATSDYARKRCRTCYSRAYRSGEFGPRTRYDGPCISCGSPTSGSGRFIKKMCDSCYRRFRLRGNPEPVREPPYNGPCIICGSPDPGYFKHFVLKMCGKCYSRHARHKPPLPRFCVDCGKQLGPKTKLERCPNCHNKWRYHNSQAHKQGVRNRTRKYRQTNNGKLHEKLHRQRRRAKIAETECTLTPEEWEQVLKSYDYRCAYCGSKENIQMDHIIPVSKNGPTTKHNIVPACRSCNMSKGNRPPPVSVQPVLI